jgi:hypothetical protein
MRRFTSLRHGGRVIFYLCLTLLINAGFVYGQFLSISISSESALPMEELIVKIIIRNTGSLPLRLTNKSEQPDFYLCIRKGREEGIIALDDFISSPVVLPGETTTNFFDVGGHHLFMDTGSYSIRAELIINDKMLKSNTCELEIARGIELTRISGITVGSDSATLKSYVLEYLKKSKGEDLYLTFEDTSAETTYGVYNLGRVVRTYPPQIKLDEAGNIHILFQTISSRFVHSVFTPFGIPIRSMAYSGYASAATFQEKADGELAVAMKDGSPLLRISDFQLERERYESEEIPQASKKKITKTGGLFGASPQ